jgi:7,8-dihydropterin-6-yl-methyl-4-(beta-D-ribofuranosyl)aminobenzene 5'-phosphate synthase
MIDPKKLRLVTLSENTAKWLWLLGEWGWSMLIEAGEFRLLFDTGLHLSAVHNAAAMGVDLPAVDRMALSHGHVDHTGGLRDVLEHMRATVGHSNFLVKRQKQVDVIAHPEVWGAKYIRHPGGAHYSFRGIPFRKAELEERQGARFVESREPVWFTEDIAWSGEVPMTNDFEKVAGICFLKEGEGSYSDDASFVPDPVNDDAAIYLRTEFGLIVVLGCAHHGMINTIHHAQQVTGMEKVHMVVGGTHLIGASEHQLDRSIQELKRLGVEKVGVSHCTGQASAARLANSLDKGVFFFNNAGNVISFS